MKDELKEVVKRIKNPFFGYFGILFFSTNWKVIFYLFVSDLSADLRIEYFDSHTSFYTLLVLPLALSIIYAVVSPWLGYVLKVVNGLPDHKRDIHTAEHEHKLALVKAKYEKIRSQFLDDYQNEIIANTKERADQIDQIKDKEIRDSLRREIQQSRDDYLILKRAEMANRMFDPNSPQGKVYREVQ